MRPSPSTPSSTASRRQQMHSCDLCRRRKVRCDSVNERPCTACKKAEVACCFTVGWRRQRRPRPSSSEVLQAQRLAPSPSARVDNGTARATPSSAVSCSCSHSRSADGSSGDRSAEDVPAPPESEVALSINIAENGLLRFFRDGLSSTTWGVFDMPDNVRVTYTGTHISNMTHLIKLDRPRPQYLVYPYPQIRPPLCTDNGSGAATGTGGGAAAAAASAPQGAHAHDGTVPITTIPPARDIHSFPEKEIRDDFIDAYFAKVNPYFPVVDEADFRARYADPNNQPALILLHSVLLVGAHVSCHSKAVHARHIVKAVLFRRAKCVFDMRHEHDRLHLVQAALLFTWHLQNGDTASSNSNYWLGVACRIAYGIGMHRDLLQDPLDPDRMPIQDRRLWRRIWWTLFQAEVLSALEHGRPSAIGRDDFDQDPLCAEDFREVNGRMNPKVQVAFCLRQAELCQIALDLVNLSAPGVQKRHDAVAYAKKRTDELNAQMVRWMLAAAASTRTDAFGEVYLRLSYHTLVIHLYRLVSATNGPSSSSSSSSSSPSPFSEDARRVGSSASGDIVSCFETLYEKNMLAQCPFTAVTALTAAAIQIGKDVQQALGSNPLLAVHGLCLLDRVCVAAEHLSVFWPNAEGVRKVFRSLFDRFTTALNGMQQADDQQADSMHEEQQISLNNLAAAAAGMDDFGGVDWTDILGLTWQVGHHHLDVGQSWDASLFGMD
ncbi:hypothetical protein SCUCBS95973_009018 [Sporothrix curviconia]|uniref:Zn(2)-C6 fungal-type domain-containing protein n=1 Tax=Sporothrix curviconia TaxID=1260050 RepID=A0ABP0CUN7_9PEZI